MKAFNLRPLLFNETVGNGNAPTKSIFYSVSRKGNHIKVINIYDGKEKIAGGGGG
jgi:hypothetical protein